MKYAVIDFGSNTFHLLIVESTNPPNFQELNRLRKFTGLCDGGISYIKKESMIKSLAACIEMKSMLDDYQIDDFRLIGTAALRSAENANEFISHAENIFQSKIEIIDGQYEAELIYKGINLLCDMKEVSIIMDIGGGSTEIMAVKDNKLIWKNSYTLGVGVMYVLFHKEEPISHKHQITLRQYIIDTMADFFEWVKDYNIINFIGASGSFEVFESMTGRPTYKNKTNTIPISQVKHIIHKLIPLSLNQRNETEGLPLSRTKYIVVAMNLIDVILDKLNVDNLIVCPYSLKEGVLSEMMSKYEIV